MSSRLLLTSFWIYTKTIRKNLMTKLVVAFTCAHVEPEIKNDRFGWLGKLLYDLRPDYVVDLGDGPDMRSLNSFDTSKPNSVVTQSYEKDIDAYNDAQERLRWPFKKNKVKRPAFYGFEGNHEHRIKRAVEVDPRVEGNRFGLSFNHLNTSKWFDEYWEYENGAPAIHNYDGIDYAHYISSGNYGTAMSGEHHAYNLLKKRMGSVSVGHSHLRNIYFRDDAKAIGAVLGCMKGGPESWAGQANDAWWSGVLIKRQLEDGYYEPQWVSLKTLEKEYA